MVQSNRTWIAFANRKKCRHADAIHNLGFINWKMGRAKFSIGDIVYLFMSDSRRVRFKLKVTAMDCPREDTAYWLESPPSNKTYKLELLDEYKGIELSEKELKKHKFKGGRSLEISNYKNNVLMEYIKNIF